MSKKVIINEDEKKKLHEKVRGEYISMRNTVANSERIAIVDRFKNEFNICETLYKSVLSHNYSKRNQKVNKKDLKLNMNQIPSVLDSAGYEIDNSLLREVFGAKSERAEVHTLKELRNGTTHGLDSKYIEEIVNRKDEIFEMLSNVEKMFELQ